ncbi:MAG: 2-oxoacid:acceptor oxidoreductase family protein [Firmicutes bacterium]|nr:2-oxoacid:acceptor oxidoreductase family protein [Bacillota bacterium]
METNICIAGFGGQGVMTIGKFLAQAVTESTDLNTVFFPTYGAEQRGGTANCFVVISDGEVGTPRADLMDDLIILNNPSLNKFINSLKPGGNLFINETIVTDEIKRDDINIIRVPGTEIALELGNTKVLNVIMLGAYIGYTEVFPVDVMWKTIEAKLGKKVELLPLNKAAFEKGLEYGRK